MAIAARLSSQITTVGPSGLDSNSVVSSLSHKHS